MHLLTRRPTHVVRKTRPPPPRSGVLALELCDGKVEKPLCRAIGLVYNAKKIKKIKKEAHSEYFRMNFATFRYNWTFFRLHQQNWAMFESFWIKRQQRTRRPCPARSDHWRLETIIRPAGVAICWCTNTSNRVFIMYTQHIQHTLLHIVIRCYTHVYDMCVCMWIYTVRVCNTLAKSPVRSTKKYHLSNCLVPVANGSSWAALGNRLVTSIQRDCM